MANKTIGELQAVSIGELPVAPDIYDETLIPVEQAGKARHMTGAQWKAYGVAAAKEEADRAEAAAKQAASSAQEAKDAKVEAENAKTSAETAKDEAGDAATAAASYASAASREAMAAATSAANAKASEGKAKTYMENILQAAEDIETYMLRADESASRAEISENEARSAGARAYTNATNAEASANAAETAKTDAGSAKTAAENAAARAEGASANAQSSVDAAFSAKLAAESASYSANTSAINAKTSETNAASSATASANSATSAALAAAEAQGYRDEVKSMLDNAEIDPSNAVLVVAQTLTDAQQAQARTNIGAASAADLAQLNNEKVAKTALSLGIGADGLIYIHVNGAPVGNGIEMGVGGDVVGYVSADNTIVLTGALADGTYTVKYEMDDGSTVDIGELTMTADGPTYTNLADPTSADWLVGYRLGTSAPSAKDGCLTTNYIPCKKGDVVRVKGLSISIVDGGGAPARCYRCDTNKNILSSNNVHGDLAFVCVDKENDTDRVGLEWEYIVGTVDNSETYMDNADSIAYIRFCGYMNDRSPSDIIITVNEEIPETE